MKGQSKGMLKNSVYASLALTISVGSATLLAAEVCDIDQNNIINQNDIDLIFQAKNTTATIPFDPMDIDRSGVIDTNDARLCVCKLPSTTDCSVSLNQVPIANAGVDQRLAQVVFNTVNLDGRLSSDPDNDSLSYQWRFQQKPEGSQAVLLNANTVTPSFIPDRFGSYTLSLTVIDGFGEKSHADSITLILFNPSPLEARPDVNSAQAGGAKIKGNLLDNDLVANRTVRLTPLFENARTLGEGKFFLQNNGNYSYEPPQFGNEIIIENLIYTITGLDGKESSSTLTITVNPLAPLKAKDDKFIVQAGGPAVEGSVLDNDFYKKHIINVTPLLTSIRTPLGGLFSLQNNGVYTYLPPKDINTTTEESGVYTITGLRGGHSSATITARVIVPNRLPFAWPDFNDATANSAAISGNVIANDDKGDEPTRVTPIYSNVDTPLGGKFSLREDGQYGYTPPQYIGEVEQQEEVEYTITDSNGDTSTSILIITINPENRQPLAEPDFSSATAGGLPVKGDVLKNDNLGNQPTKLKGATDKFKTLLGGEFTLEINGTYTYTPPKEMAGVSNEKFDYTITDVNGGTSSTTLTIRVSPENLFPLAKPDTNSTAAGNEDGIDGNVLTGGVSGSDNPDELGNEPTFAALISSDNTLGTLTFKIDGSYNYVPPPTVSGVVTDIFTYEITDANGDSSSTTLTIAVSPENLFPLAKPDTNSTAAGNEDGIDGNVLTGGVSGGDNPDELGNEPTFAALISSDNTLGTLTFKIDGSYNYVPPPTVSGVVTDIFTYEITDANGDSSSTTLTIAVSPENLFPLAKPDTNSTVAGNEDGIDGNVLTGGVSGGDNPDELGNEPTFAALISSDNTLGTLTFNIDGSYNYVPPPTVSGVVTDVFRYKITDANGDTNSTTLSITVSPANLRPVAVPYENNATSGAVYANGTIHATAKNALGDVLLKSKPGDLPALVSYSALNSNGNSNAPSASVSEGVLEGDFGSLKIEANGRYTYTPYAYDFPYIVPPKIENDEFTYTIKDKDDETDTSTLTIQVNPPDLIPVAHPDTNSAIADGSDVKGNVLRGNVSPGDNPDELGNEPTFAALISSDNTLGILTFNADGSYNYEPPSTRLTGGNVVIDVFTYEITDADGRDPSRATLTITVSPVNLTPIAKADTNSAIADGSDVKGNVLRGNVSPGDNPDELGNEPTFAALISSDNTLGILTFNADGSYNYEPPSTRLTGGNVVIDVFTYEITDADGRDPSRATLTITVSPANLRPIAVLYENNATAGAEETNGTIRATVKVASGNVLVKSQPGDLPASVSYESLTGKHGSLKVEVNGDYTYTPNPYYLPYAVPPSIEIDQFTYTITDKDKEADTSTLTIQVNPPDLIPKAEPDEYKIGEFDDPLIIDVLGNDFKGDEPVSIVFSEPKATFINVGGGGTRDGQPKKGDLVLESGGYRYKPPSKIEGDIKFEYTYKITDQNNNTAESTLSIVVTKVYPPID